MQTLPEPIVGSISTSTGATDIQVDEKLQTLWGGYGGIFRLSLNGTKHRTAILKLIQPPQQAQHPRGWNTPTSHQRKIHSYKVETHWYANYAGLCGESCRVPLVLSAGSDMACQWILMEDLTTHYPLCVSTLSMPEAAVCLRWLAAFHASFIGKTPNGLWPVGTYWHLDTRQDELKNMPKGELKSSAAKLDNLLKECPYQSIVHGDAKLANFCFSKNKSVVAAVDFQYVGGGVGVKDVVYFLGSCLDENTIEKNESALLSVYFTALRKQIAVTHSDELAQCVERAWSDLYAIAWTDFYRFLEGWMPGHKKINRYTKVLADRAFDQIALR